MARLAFLLPDFRGGGAEHVALTLVNALSASGHEVDLLLCRREGVLLDALSDRVRVIDLQAPRLRNAIRPLVAYLRRERPVGLQVSMWPLTSIAVVARLLARSRTRLILSEHSNLTRFADVTAGGKTLTLRGSVGTFHRLADKVVAVSDGVKRDLIQLGVPPATIEVVRNPLPVASGDEGSFDWPGRGKRVLAVGNLVEAKNHALLLRAFASVAQRIDASLVICGEGPLRGELERTVAELHLSHRVFLIGYQPNLTPIYRAADLFVLSSDAEGYSLVLVEALAAGLPIVSTDCPSGPAEILEGGTYGALVPVGGEEALAEAVIEGLGSAVDPARQKARAADLNGQESISRYEQLLVGALDEGS